MAADDLRDAVDPVPGLLGMELHVSPPVVLFERDRVALEGEHAPVERGPHLRPFRVPRHAVHRRFHERAVDRRVARLARRGAGVVRAEHVALDALRVPPRGPG